ncbi:hypothetical protein [Mucilaginibacter arboris]|uniref:Uncharacterized protein n=1 Tax=Mucilaginibacter arboris TaxID=2682090 RepID=A0A7K1SXX6_9SPHI|nr:hypothetical protein [Mucilaginibacter arboris]MVN21870.1 hypothetical protein [Mucilaginibacter arboris]
MVSKSALAVVLLICCSFQNNELEELVPALQNTLQHSLQFPAQINTAKTKVEVNQAGFVRYTQTLKSGKQNYASLNLCKFLKLDYWGTTQSGMLILRSAKNNVIIQTFNDPAGDVDSMSTHLDIPVASIEPDQLNTVEQQLQRIKVLLQKKPQLAINHLSGP